MAEPKTSLNESLCCIALGYIREYPNNTEQNFIDMVLDENSETPKEWTESIKDCEISSKRHIIFRSAYKNNEDWIIGSYRTALKINQILNINLSDYIISRVEKSQDNHSYYIKEIAAGAIRNYAKVYGESKLGRLSKFSPGILTTLRSDKINIADIMLIKKGSEYYKNIKKMSGFTLGYTNAKELSPDILNQLLTPKEYRRILTEAWVNKEIFGVSLKKLNTNSTYIPAKILNVDRSVLTTTQQQYEDDFKFFITNLIASAKSNDNYTSFEKMIDDSIQIEPVEFTSTDRLEIKYKFSYKVGNTNKTYDYLVWSNFGAGTLQVYFEQVGTGSASGEGGITLGYFNTLSKRFPKLSGFLTHMARTREAFFRIACSNHNVDYESIKSKMGDAALSSGKYHSSLYTPNDYKKLVHILLTNVSPLTQDDLLSVIDYRINLVTQTDAELHFYDGTENKKITINYNAIAALEEFFKLYTQYLTNNTSKMGRYFGLSITSASARISRASRVKTEFNNLYKRAVAKKQKDKLTNKEKKLPVKQRIKGSSSEETKKLKAEAASMIKLTKRESDSIRKKALETALKRNKESEVTYKKSFALLSNAEFGYMFSEHAEYITSVLKKQVLLSLYAAASGRGYIVFDGKKFEVEDYFEKDVEAVPFLKIGM